MKRMALSNITKRTVVKGKCIILIMLMILAIVTQSSCTKDSGAQFSASAAKSETVAKTTARAGTATVATSTASASTATGVTEKMQTDSRTNTSDERTESGEQTALEDSRTEEQSQQTQDELEETEVIDLGGMVIDVDLIFEVRVPKEDNPVPQRSLEWHVSKEIEKKYNCKINYMVQYANNNTLTLNAIREKALSGTETVEVQYVSLNWIVPSMVESGYFLRLDDYLPKDSFAYESFVKNLTEWKGHGYGFCFMGKATGIPMVLSYNKEIMDRLGIDIWEQYIYKGIWTWENFVNVARAATQDVDGDGIVDQWGLKGWSEQEIAYCLIASNGGRIISYGDDGSVKYTLHNDPKSVKALQFMSDLYNVYKVTFMGGNAKEIMQNGFGAMSLLLNAGSFSASYYTDPQSAKKIHIAPVPMGPDFDKYVTRYNTYIDTMAMPNIPTNPNADVVRVMAEIYSETYRRLGMGDGDTFNVVNVNAKLCQSWFMNNLDVIPQFLEIIRLGDDPVMQNLAIFNPLPSQLTSQVLNQIARDAVPVTTKLMETKDMMQSYIDAVLGN